MDEALSGRNIRQFPTMCMELMPQLPWPPPTAARLAAAQGELVARRPQFSYTYDPTGAVQGNSATLTATNVAVTVNVTVSLPNWVEYNLTHAQNSALSEAVC
jgi:hypothetical protein